MKAGKAADAETRAQQEALRYLLGRDAFPDHAVVRRALRYHVADHTAWLRRARAEAYYRHAGDPIPTSWTRRACKDKSRQAVDRVLYGNNLALMLKPALQVYTPVTLGTVEILKPDKYPFRGVGVEDLLYLVLLGVPHWQRPQVLLRQGAGGKALGYRLTVDPEYAQLLYKIQTVNVDCGVHRLVLTNFRALLARFDGT